MSKRRPSPAMIVAVIALVLGLGGAAVAADLSKSQVKKIAKKQANKQINKRAPGLSVANATNATNATNAGNVDGHSVIHVFKTFNDGQNGVVIAQFGPYTMTADCANDIENLEITTDTLDVALNGVSNGNAGPTYDEDNGGSAPNEIELDDDGTNDDDRGVATFNLTQTNGTTYSGEVGYDDPDIFDGQDVCNVSGHIVADG